MYEDELIEAVDNSDFDEIIKLIKKGGIINYNILNEIIFMNEDLDLFKKVITYISNSSDPLDISKILLKCISKCDSYSEFIDILLTIQIKINDISKVKLTDLLYHVINDGCNVKLVKFLVHSGADINLDMIKIAREVGDRYGDSTTDVLEFLLERLDLIKILAKTWLNDWVFKKMQHKKNIMNLPIGIEKFYKRNKTETVYRGLYWNSEDIAKNFYKLIDNDRYIVKDKLVLDLRDLTSWSKDKIIAEDFARRSIAKHKKFNNVERYGIVLKLNVVEKNILADVNLTLNINHEEKEIIIFPGKYKCEIYKIFLNGKEVQALSSFNLYKNASID